MLECLLLKNFKKFNGSRSLSNAARISSTFLKSISGLQRLFSFSNLDSQLKFTVEKKISL